MISGTIRIKSEITFRPDLDYLIIGHNIHNVISKASKIACTCIERYEEKTNILFDLLVTVQFTAKVVFNSVYKSANCVAL